MEGVKWEGLQAVWRCKTVMTNKGFTLLSMMIALFALGIFTSLFVMTLSTLHAPVNKLDQDKELQVFIEQLRIEIHSASDLVVQPNHILFTFNNSQVGYSQYSNYIRRAVYGQGNNIVLQNVKSIHFQPDAGGLKMTVIQSNGEVSTHVFLIFLASGG